MRTGSVFVLSLFCWGITACGSSGGSGGGSGGGGGGGGGGGNPVFAVSHTLAQSKPVTLNAKGFYGFEFLLPDSATVDFSVSETTTDTWNVAIWTPAEWVSYQNGSGNQAYTGLHTGVTRVTDSVTVPAGDWYLGFRCTNSIERCMFLFDLDATY